MNACSRLSEIYEDLRDFIDSMQGQIEESARPWVHDLEFVERTHQLRRTTDACLLLAGQGSFREALALSRTALEHQAIDSLLLLGTRRNIQILDVDENEYRVLAEKMDSSGRFETHCHLRSKSRVDAVIAAGSATHEHGDEQISFYYWAAREFRPGFVPASFDGDVVRPTADHGSAPEVTSHMRSAYRQFWKWATVLRNLELTEIISPFERVQTEVHYTFLSKFCHGLVFDEGDFENSPIRLGLSARQSGALTELVHLYALNTVRLELTVFCTYAEERPRLSAVDTEQLRLRLGEANDETGYFWFRGGAPTEYDRLLEQRSRDWINFGWSSAPSTDRDLAPRRAEDLEDQDVRYYTDPLERLKILRAQRR